MVSGANPIIHPSSRCPDFQDHRCIGSQSYSGLEVRECQSPCGHGIFDDACKGLPSRPVCEPSFLGYLEGCHVIDVIDVFERDAQEPRGSGCWIVRSLSIAWTITRALRQWAGGIRVFSGRYIAHSAEEAKPSTLMSLGRFGAGWLPLLLPLAVSPGKKKGFNRWKGPRTFEEELAVVGEDAVKDERMEVRIFKSWPSEGQFDGL